MTSEDFFSSAWRHLEDSSSLFNSGRLDNAAYLAGYVIECSLKYLVERQRGISARPYGHDLRGMTASALPLAALLAPGSARYRVDKVATLSAAIRLWKPEMRYRATGAVTGEEAQFMMDCAREVARRVLVALALDGVEEPLR